MRIVVLVFVGILAAGGCARSVTDSVVDDDPCAGQIKPAPCPWVHVTPAAASMTRGQTVQFTASWDAKFGPVTWH